jgi:hypothetical protein
MIQETKESTPQEVLHSMSFGRSELDFAIREHFPDIYACYEIRTKERMPLEIKFNLFAGMNIEAAHKNLKDSGYSDEIIAYIFIEKNNFPLTETGKILSGNEAREDRSYRDRAKNLFESARRKYIFTFIK